MKKAMILCVAAAIFLAVFSACSNPSGGGGGSTPLTGLSVSPSQQTVVIGKTATLQAVRTPANGKGTLEWESEDPDYVTVSATGVITGVQETETDTPVKVWVRSKDDPSIENYCEVTVIDTLNLALYTNSTAATVDGSEPTTTVPSPVNNIYAINGYYDPLTSKLPDSTSGFKDATFVYLDKLLTGNFRLRIRARMTATPVANSTAKGMIIGGFTQDGDAPGETSLINGIVYRCSGGSGANPYALRSALSKATSQPDVGGLNQPVGKTDEYIFEVTRTDTGYVHTVYISKTGAQLATSSSNFGADAGVTATTPVYAGIAFASVRAEISQIELWVGHTDGDPAYYSGDSLAAPVGVDSIQVGVQGGTVDTTGGKNGTAPLPAEYVVRATDAVANGIQLVTTVTPSYADETGVKYYLFTPDPEDAIQIGEDSGKVTVTGPGTATILAISLDTAEPEYYLTIIVTEDYVPVGAFNIVAEKTSILQNLETITLSTDIPTTVTNPEVVWTTDDADTVVFIDGDGDPQATVTGATATIKGLALGTATITAQATTTDGVTPTVKYATKDITVTGGGGGTDVFYNFSIAPFNNGAEGLQSPISTTQTLGGVTFIISGTNTMTYTANNKTYDSTAFTMRLQLTGTGSTTSRALSFVVSGACTVRIYAISGTSGTATRALALSDGTTVLTNDYEGDAGGGQDYVYTGGPATLYVYSTNSGINLYGIKVSY